MTNPLFADKIVTTVVVTSGDFSFQYPVLNESSEIVIEWRMNHRSQSVSLPKVCPSGSFRSHKAQPMKRGNRARQRQPSEETAAADGRCFLCLDLADAMISRGTRVLILL
jgi:hypothetical protein